VTTVFDGLSVLDLTHGQAGALVTMILADNGASVTRLEPSASASYRGDPAAGLGGRVQWHRGKEVVPIDLKSDAGQQQAKELAASADVIVDSFRPGVLSRLGLGWEQLSAGHPMLISCSITGFGSAGPYRDLPGYEGIVAAIVGKMTEFGAGRGRPSYVAVPFLSFAASQSALHGICGALLVRQHTGRGQRVETSLVAAASPYDILDSARHALGAPQSATPPTIPLAPPGIVAPAGLGYLTSRTADGRWVQWANHAPHLFWNELDLLGLGELRMDPAFGGLPTSGSEEARLAVWEAVLRGTAKLTFDQLTDLTLAHGGVGCELMRNTQEGMDHPQARHNGDVVRVVDPRVGPSEQLGPIALLRGTPSVIGERVPATSPWPAPRSDELPIDGPLSGVTIVEAAAMYAAPFGPAVLADYGARVIKIEPLTGDPMGAFYGDGPAKVMYGKERVSLDLKQPEAQEIVRRLVAQADVFVHNYRPGVPERLGIGEETLRSVCSDLIYLYAGAYGADGPYSSLPAYHPSAGAICGNAVLQAGEGVPPPVDRDLSEDELKGLSVRLSRANEGNPDPNAAMAVATAIFLALVARSRHGVGQSVQTSMLAANAYVMSDDWIRYDGRPDRAEPDADLNGVGPGYRLYETAEGWVFLACTNEAEWTQFREIVPEVPDPPNEAELAALFRGRTATEWETDLTKHGVACVRADRPTYGWFLRDDPGANGLLTQAEHPTAGPHRRQEPMATLSLTPGSARSSEPPGASTRRVLAELGYPDAEIEDLASRGVIGL
jgi:crotonobetainyl-CoA:carnitine CoA-transferase CaiB-like acyl-CoA transferase